MAAAVAAIALSIAAASAQAVSTTTIEAMRIAHGCPAGVRAPTPAARDAARPRRLGRVRNLYGSGIFGIAAGGGIQVERRRASTTDLRAFAEAGARWLRIDINWASIQAAGPSSYAWAATDRVVREAHRCGMNVLGVLYYTPSWARPPGTAPTYAPRPAAFGRFARRAAAHYRRLGVDSFEIWNEPNLASSFAPTAGSGAYTALLKAADAGIKRADPAAIVVTGGLAPTPGGGGNVAPIAFLRGIYAHGGEPYFDAVGAHPYCWPAYPGARYSWSAWFQMYGTRTSLRSVMRRHGDGAKQIWATEFGAPTGGPAGTFVSPARQAAMVSRAYVLWSTYSWAGPLFMYSGRDQGTDPSTNFDFYGLLAYDYRVKPSFVAYWEVSHELAQATQASRAAR